MSIRKIVGKTLRAVGVKDTAYLKHRFLGEPYVWTDFPRVIQLDLCNRCGPAHCGVLCSYCRPQRDILKGVKQSREMSDEVIDWVLGSVTKYGRNMHFLADFLDGDGLDPCLPEKRRRIKKAAPWLKIQTFTCGTRPEYAQLLTGAELDWICVTLSAHNPTVYNVVHGGNRFNQVLETMRYLQEHARPNQLLEVHYVINKHNFAYMKDWLTLMQREFPRFSPKFSPLVNTGADDVSNGACGALSTVEQEDAVKSVGGAGFWDRRELDALRPCVLWDNDDVGADGSLLQCCRWDRMDWGYGNAADYIKNGWSFRDYHMQKVLNKLRNPFCDRCNLKAPNWQKLTERIDVRGVIKP